MARSFLFKGRDTEHLSPAERQLEELYDRLDRPGRRLTDAQFYALPEVAQALDGIYGALGDRVPPGSQIVRQTPGKIEYRDADGYTHSVTRNPRTGAVSTLSDRPAIVPTAASRGQEDFLQQLQARLQQGLNQPTTLAQLDPETAKALAAISQAEQAANSQQLGDLQGQLLARLFGNGVNRSSIATNAGARFAQQAGLVNQQQRSDAANRELNLRNLLTTLAQQQRALNTDLYANLTGQANQRDIAGAGLTLDRARLDEAGRQFDAGNYLDTLRTQLEREKLDAANSPFNKFLQTVGAVGSIAGAAGGGLSAFNALRGGSRGGSDPLASLRVNGGGIRGIDF